jgi:hypothetical protein
MNLDQAYEIFGIQLNKVGVQTERITFVHKKFRELSLKHHPDKFASNDEDHKKANEDYYKKVLEAYNFIKSRFELYKEMHYCFTCKKVRESRAYYDYDDTAYVLHCIDDHIIKFFACISCSEILISYNVQRDASKHEQPSEQDNNADDPTKFSGCSLRRCPKCNHYCRDLG